MIGTVRDKKSPVPLYLHTAHISTVVQWFYRKYLGLLHGNRFSKSICSSRHALFSFIRNSTLLFISLDSCSFPCLLVLQDMVFYPGTGLFLVLSELHVHKKHTGCITDRFVRFDDILELWRDRIGEMR